MRDMKQHDDIMYDIANYIIENEATMEATANAFKISKSAVDRMLVRLKVEDNELYIKVRMAIETRNNEDSNVRILPKSSPKEEQLLLLQEYSKTKDKDIENKLIETNIRLVYHIAKKFIGEDIDELIQIGTIGLANALKTFKVDRNIHFATYASRCIENEMLMYLRRKKKYRNDKSMQETIAIDHDGQEYLIEDVLEDTVNNMERYLENKEIKEKLICILDIILNNLSYREKIVFFKYLSGYKQWQIGEMLQWSQSYISRLIENARKKLCINISFHKPIANLSKRYDVAEYKEGYRVRTKCEKSETVDYIQKKYSAYVKIVENGYIEIFILPDEESMNMLADIIISLE